MNQMSFVLSMVVEDENEQAKGGKARVGFDTKATVAKLNKAHSSTDNQVRSSMGKAPLGLQRNKSQAPHLKFEDMTNANIA